MKLNLTTIWAVLFLGASLASEAKLSPEQIKALPPPATHKIDFKTEIKPIFDTSCIRCHGRGRAKGGFQLDTRETFLKGGDSGAAAEPGKSATSYLVALVSGLDDDGVMPKKGTKLTAEQVGVVRAWIDQGLTWDADITFSKVAAKNLTPRLPEVPAGKAAQPADRFLDAYFAEHKIKAGKTVDDRVYARRVWLDVLGLLPPPKELEAFLADNGADKRARLVHRLLSENDNYAQHWMSFWNDMLRNDYKGTGYIDGGRKQITKWLYTALATNKPYDQFVAELVNPTAESEGFSKGIVWRGVVNASQVPQMQAAQNISQVFMGVNLKCASCHDSFINDWQLSDAYALANIYSDKQLEIFQCDKPTGKKADVKFIYAELGLIHGTNKQERLAELAKIITSKKDGRLSRTLVNRLWTRFMGHGLVESVDDMEQPAWNQDLLDWLAEDMVAHNYDVRHTIEVILTSRAYQLPAVNVNDLKQDNYIFTGPAIRRLTAEEFRDALTSLTGIGYSAADTDVAGEKATSDKFGAKAKGKWIWNSTNAAVKARAEVVYFRKTFTVWDKPTDARALIACDNSFTLYVNGTKAGSGNDYTKGTVINIAPLLTTGENLVAIEAFNNLPDNTFPTPAKAVAGTENPAGLFAYIRVRTEKAGKERILDFASDETWTETNKVATGWEKLAYNAKTWPMASALGAINMIPWRLNGSFIANHFSEGTAGQVRAALVAADPLMVALGRPNREQVVTTRPTTATTLQALELTNGGTLSQILKHGAADMVKEKKSTRELIARVYEQAVGRKPTTEEIKLAEELMGKEPKKEGVEDFLWAMAMLPEFQLIY